MDHPFFIKRCLELAIKGAGLVAPNPMVGALIVYDGRIVSEGYHAQFGGPHAEVVAINHALENGFDKFSESTLYVNLEPCSHYGKTSPCADLIIHKSFQQVVIAQTDPNPIVAGSGLIKLQQAGIKVINDICFAEAMELNRKFNTFYKYKRPYITLKWSQSKDGFIAHADFSPVKLTNYLSDVLVHKFRAEHMSICVGGRTIISDNPQLNVRHWPGNSPTRIILDSKGRISSNAFIFDNSVPTIVFNPTVSYTKNSTEFIQWNAMDGLKPVLQILFEKQIQSIFVEGGAQTHNRFLRENLWDELIVFDTNHLLENGIVAPEMPAKSYTTNDILNDHIITMRNL